MIPNFNGVAIFAFMGIAGALLTVGYGIWLGIDWLFLSDTEAIELHAPIDNEEPTRLEYLYEDGNPLPVDTLYIYEKETPSFIGRQFE